MNYINKHKTKINESILMDALPSDIVSKINSHETSLGNNPAIPDIFDIPFLSKISNKRFENIKNTLKTIGSINDVESNDLHYALSELILKCKEIEKPFRSKLEKICYNYVISLFSIPEETIVFNLELNEAINTDKCNIFLEPIDGDENIELDDINDAMSFKKEIYKRRLLDAICMGAGMDLVKPIFDFYKSEIDNINPKLIKIYKEILLLNDYLLFTKEDLGITDENKLQMGLVEVRLGNDEFKTTIDAQGTIFPILVIETIRGLMELFISHGLPKDRKRTMELLNKTDFIKAEPWDMRLGPELWKLLSMSFNNIDSKELPYLLKRISTLNVDKFNFLMKEVFAKTKKGKEIMSFLCNKAKNDMDYNRFVDKMDKMKLNNSLITDEYIHLNEL
jgi:hypothetical protein